ncbi:MAG: hypothetical protein G8237_02115 [Magnetococcales bacterium]|nr:hypothetical protein [Magnetococcales bacterium]
MSSVRRRRFYTCLLPGGIPRLVVRELHGIDRTEITPAFEPRGERGMTMMNGRRTVRVEHLEEFGLL